MPQNPHQPQPRRFSPARPCVIEDVPHWDLETDVLVVGFGAAGACAAIEARQAGARVRVLEVASAGGGSASWSGGEVYVGGSGGTSVQRAHGFEDSTEDLAAYLMMAGGPGADGERVHTYAHGAEAHFRWLQDQGVPFKGSYLPGKWIEPTTDDTLLWSGSEQAWPFRDKARPAPRGHTAQFVGWGGGKVLMEKLCAKAAELGAEVHTDSRALTLIVDRAHAVVGVVARMDGAEKFIRAHKGVILCAGGFILNKEMLARFTPGALACTKEVSGGNDDGSGIRMGMAVGGAAIHMDQFFATVPFFPPASLVKGIFINGRGERFINEDAYHGRVAHYVLRQPEGKAWLLVDDEIFGRPVIKPDVTVAAVGESWEEIETELGLPAGSLVHTVETFNAQAAAGNDPLFHKAPDWLRPLTKAPFAAISYCSADLETHAFTLGGLATRPSGEVLDGDGQPIRGLFAAGRSACGLPRWGEGYSSGLSLGDSTFFGRMAGKSAAA